MNFQDIFEYNPSYKTGLKWKVAGFHKTRQGTDAGSINRTSKGEIAGYRVKYLKASYYVSRIIYEMHHGPIPKGLIVDHKDGDCLKNNIENLRLTTQKVNSRNQKQRKSHLGISGVNLNKGKQTISARWMELDGTQKDKTFSINKYGLEEAIRLATAYRINKMNELNNNGAQYSERHLKGTL